MCGGESAEGVHDGVAEVGNAEFFREEVDGVGVPG